MEDMHCLQQTEKIDIRLSRYRSEGEQFVQYDHSFTKTLKVNEGFLYEIFHYASSFYLFILALAGL
jgi:hypothetical protein